MVTESARMPTTNHIIYDASLTDANEMFYPAQASMFSFYHQ